MKKVVRRTANETALLIILLFKESELNRIRISQKTLKFLARRKKLRTVFVTSVIGELAEYDIGMVELGSGAFGIFRYRSLESAKAATAARYLPRWIEAIKGKDTLDFDDIEEEIEDFVFAGEAEENEG